MSFQQIVTSNKTFLERGRGVYSASDVSFGAPANEFRLRANTNKKAPSVGIGRYLEQDIVSGSNTIRVGANVLLTISMPTVGITTAQVDAMASDIAEFCTPANISDLLQGRN